MTSSEGCEIKAGFECVLEIFGRIVEGASFEAGMKTFVVKMDGMASAVNTPFAFTNLFSK